MKNHLGKWLMDFSFDYKPIYFHAVEGFPLQSNLMLPTCKIWNQFFFTSVITKLQADNLIRLPFTLHIL